MKNAKVLVFGLLLSGAALVSADECCQATNEVVVAPETAVVTVDPVEAAKLAKKLADEKAAADAAQANQVVAVADQK